MTVPTEVASDEKILAMLDKVWADTGEVLGRNEVRRAAGMGASRATRLRKKWSITRGVPLPEDTSKPTTRTRAPARTTNGNGGGPDQVDQTVEFARIGPATGPDQGETGPQNGHAAGPVRADRGQLAETLTGLGLVRVDRTEVEAAAEPGPGRVEVDRTVSAWVSKSVPATLTYVSRFGWIVVLLAAFGISWWSLFELALGFGMPVILAAVVSLVFDGAALIVAHLSHQYALSQDSGAGPRVVLIGVLAGSVFLNWKHAQALGFGMPASIMFAAPAAVAILLFELQTGWDSRQARRANGRVSDPLPVIGRWGWIFHPVQSIGTVWQVSAARGKHIRRVELEKWEQRP